MCSVDCGSELVNDNIREAAVGFDGAEAQAVWEFMCECGVPDCKALVRLTVNEYDRLKALDEAVLAHGHELSRTLQAHRKAEALREESKALGAQAEQQVRRARAGMRRRRP